jgi:hypothetical protein
MSAFRSATADFLRCSRAARIGVEARQLDPHLEDVRLASLADPGIGARELDEAFGDPGVLEVDRLLRGREEVLVVRATDIARDVELAHPQVRELDLGVLAGRARERIQASRRGKRLPQPEHERVRLIPAPTGARAGRPTVRTSARGRGVARPR